MPDTIQPQIDLEQATLLLSRRPGFLRKHRRASKLELFYLPSYLVRLRVAVKKHSQILTLCIDGIEGRFAFYHSSARSETIPEQALTCPYVLDLDGIRQITLSEYRRYLLRQNLLLRSNGQIEKILDIEPVYYPFWLAYFKRRRKIDFDVIDAVSGDYQGAAERSVFMKALLHETSLDEEMLSVFDER